MQCHGVSPNRELLTHVCSYRYSPSSSEKLLLMAFSKMSFLHGFLWLKTSIRLRTRIRNAHLHVSVAGGGQPDGPTLAGVVTTVLVIPGQCPTLWKVVISRSAVSVTFSNCPSFTTRGSCYIRLCAVGYLRPRASITSLNNCFKQPRGSITHSRLTGECVIIAQGNSARHLYKDSL